MAELPNDPKRLAEFYMNLGSADTLLATYNYLLELQNFNIEQVWPVDSPEYKAAADTIEVIKYQVALLETEMIARSQALLE